ncbi:uncharacterized protein C2845_PM07G24410 [Panicum miliaceum]|uniref:Uncharacterized protein n=1 Tax=Panicum miliaceum TaxID=4540 RepID=A0A3L6ST27_PANMI|nr:uncharacterized protein C2845_PM07G24410 [Panicum miliaceum]
MGWRWHNDNGESGRGLAGGEGEGPQCATRRVVQSRCHTEEVEPGRFVRKCEKTEQLLRDCVGRPSELVESKTENTEEDVTEEMKNGSVSLGFPTNEPFAFPGIRSDIKALEKGLLGSLDSVLNEAERMTNDFFKSFGFPSIHDRQPSPFQRQPAERHIEEGFLPPLASSGDAHVFHTIGVHFWLRARIRTVVWEGRHRLDPDFPLHEVTRGHIKFIFGSNSRPLENRVFAASAKAASCSSIKAATVASESTQLVRFVQVDGASA